MATPSQLRIPHDPDPDGRFHYVGRTSDGQQFMAFVTGAFKYDSSLNGQRLDGEKKWMAVVHIFASDGTHLKTEIRVGGSDAEEGIVARQAAWAELETLLSELDLAGASPADIWVSPFQVTRGGIRYGLVYEAYEEDGETHEHVMLEPNDVMFHPPWEKGQYST